MYLGIDVGGTFTDGVILEGGRVVQWSKVPTAADLTQAIDHTLKVLLQNQRPEDIERVVLSTTLITNLLAAGQNNKAAFILMPGPGVPVASLAFAGEYKSVKGALDYRGRIIEEPDYREIEEAIRDFRLSGYRNIVVACKFAPRNPGLENRAAEFIEKKFPDLKVMASNKCSGQLNWVRRANGTLFTLAVKAAVEAFLPQVRQVLAQYGLNCPYYLLKADGGTMPLELAGRYPLEAIFSGPAASTMGALAALDKKHTCVVMDIGGTTTDLALILNGLPLMAEKGAEIRGFPLPVRALALSSIALGGDTTLEIINGTIQLGERNGPVKGRKK